MAGKGLLARLVPEYRAAGISADDAPKKRPYQQRPLRHAAGPRPSADLIEADQQECPKIDQRKRREDVGKGEEGVEGHK